MDCIALTILMKLIKSYLFETLQIFVYNVLSQKEAGKSCEESKISFANNSTFWFVITKIGDYYVCPVNIDDNQHGFLLVPLLTQKLLIYFLNATRAPKNGLLIWEYETNNLN